MSTTTPPTLCHRHPVPAPSHPYLCLWSQGPWASGQTRGSIKNHFGFRLSPKGEELLPGTAPAAAPTCTHMHTHTRTRVRTGESEAFWWSPGASVQPRRCLSFRSFTPSGPPLAQQPLDASPAVWLRGSGWARREPAATALEGRLAPGSRDTHLHLCRVLARWLPGPENGTRKGRGDGARRTSPDTLLCYRGQLSLRSETKRRQEASGNLGSDDLLIKASVTSGKDSLWNVCTKRPARATRDTADRAPVTRPSAEGRVPEPRGGPGATSSPPAVHSLAVPPASGGRSAWH